MKRILINATHNEEVRVALCKDNHLYDFDLENRTREQKKANIYKGHITRVEPSLEAAFVEYGSVRQGFLPLREIAPEYLHGNAREDNIRQLLKEGDEVIVQVEKEERGNKGAALSTYISLAGRYLVLMPNNAKAGGISRQISGKVREEMKQIIASLSIPKGMSVIVRTAGLGKGFEDLQNDLNHLLDIWTSILDQNKKRPSPCLVHQEAGVVTRAVRDYLRDDISEVWIDSENAYNEAANFIAAVMPTQLDKLRKYTEYEPMFARFGIERQIETAYQREVRLPSGGSIVIDQTEAMVAIDINSSRSTKGSDVSETAYHTNLEAADEIARQLRLRDMGGLIVIDFIDMADARHQKDVEKRLIEATRHDRARVQFAEISKLGLMEMSRQRLRPSLEESTGYICPRCHGNGMIRDLRSLSLSIMRQIEQIALKERMGEIQAEVPTEIAAFLLNEKRESLVYLEQDSGTRITVLPHAHLESPNFSLHFNPDGFAPSSYERIAHAEEEEMGDRGYDTNWHTENEQVENKGKDTPNRWQKANTANEKREKAIEKQAVAEVKAEPQVAAWLSNLFAPKPQAQLAGGLNNSNAAAAIESIINAGGVSLGASGTANLVLHTNNTKDSSNNEGSDRSGNDNRPARTANTKAERNAREDNQERRNKKKVKKEVVIEEAKEKADKKPKKEESSHPKRESGSRRDSRGEILRGETLSIDNIRPNHKADERAKQAHKESSVTNTPNEVVVNVTPMIKEEKTGETIHISLDGSKPDVVKADKPNKTINAQSDLTTPDAKIQTTDEVINAADTLSITPAHNQDNTTPAVAEVSGSVIVTDNAQQAEMGKMEEQFADQASNQTIAPNSRLIELARQMNKAVNDPRVVIANESKPNAVFGTAGEFIERVLGTDKGDDFVQNFINACTKNQVSVAEFNFSNYGYAPLATTYLAAFDKKTSVASRISAPQGKTKAPALRITRRATNDPRGQHPDFVEAGNESDATVNTTKQNTNQDETLPKKTVGLSVGLAVDESKVDTSESASSTKQMDATSDEQAQVADNSNDAKQSKADEANTAKSKEKPEETLIEQIKDGLESAIDALGDTIGDLFNETNETDKATKANETDEVSTTDQKASSKAPADVADSSVTPDASSSEDNKKSKKRTNSYKDMIENVAGQLLPQVGILNLAQPKPAKTRIKKTASKSGNKPKSEVRKAGEKISKSKLKKDPNESDTNK